MKLAFVCPTSERGSNGIADYTLRLSAYCARAGIETKIFPIGTHSVFYNTKAYRTTISDLRSRIEEFRPDVISWQYDGNLFSPRRLFPPWIVPDLSDLAPKIHWMVHETWEGVTRGQPFPKIIKGAAQRLSLVGFHWRTKPDLVHTSIPLYQDMLINEGIEAKLLPMISNIENLGSGHIPEPSPVHLILFGGVYPEIRVEELRRLLSTTAKKPIIHHAGINRNPDPWNKLKSDLSDLADFREHGTLDVNPLSNLISQCHAGLSTIPGIIIGKSTVYHAFREHSLLVINIVSNQKTKFTIDPHSDPGYRDLTDIGDIGTLTRIPLNTPSLERTGRIFISDLLELDLPTMAPYRSLKWTE